MLTIVLIWIAMTTIPVINPGVMEFREVGVDSDCCGGLVSVLCGFIRIHSAVSGVNKLAPKDSDRQFYPISRTPL